MSEIIGSVQVDITGNQAPLNAALKQATENASAGGQKISAALNSAIAPASGLEKAILTLNESVIALNATLSKSGAASNAAAAGARSHAAALHGVVSQVQGTSAAIRVLEGNGGIRAVENFVAKTLGLGPAMQAIFPIVGGIAFGEIIGRMTGEAIKFFQESSQGAERTKSEFRELTLGIQTTNDELQLSNDKLDNQIAKLTGKRQNALKEMIDEAAVAADHLATRLDAALKGLIDLLKKEEVGFTEAVLTNQGTSGTATSPAMSRVLGGESGVGGKRAEISQIEDQGRARIKAAQALGDVEIANAARLEVRNRLEAEYGALIKHNQADLQISQNIQKQHDQGGLNAFLFPDQTKQIEIGKATGANLRAQLESSLLEFENVSKKQALGIAQTGKVNAEEAKKAAQEWLRAQEEAFGLLKSQDAVTLSEETQFWADRLAIARSRGAAYADEIRQLTIKLGNLHQEEIRRGIEAVKRSDAEDLKAIEQSIKEAAETATESGGHPAAVRLKMLTDATSSDNGLDAESARKLANQIPDAQRAAFQEAKQELHKSLSEEEAAWKESGSHTLQDTIAFFETRKRLYASDADVVKHANLEIAAANKQLLAERLKVTDLGAGASASHAEADIQAQKIALQSEYDSKVVKTYQDEINYARQLADLDERALEIKRAKAEIEIKAANAAGDNVRATQASVEWLAADDAIRTHRLQTELEINRLQRDSSFRGRTASGLGQDLSSAGQSLASSFGQAVANNKGIGQVFQQSLKNLEGSAISTVLGNAFKTAIQASGISAIFNKLGGALAASPQVAATTTNTAAIVALNAHLIGLFAALGINTAASGVNSAATTADASVTAVHGGIMTTHLGVMVAHMGTMIANTASVLANTIATIWNTIVEGVKTLFGFADGGRPPVGIPSVIGERGPELFIPDVPGTIIPNHALATMAGGTSGITNFSNTGGIGQQHFHIYGMNDPDRVMRQIAKYSKSRMAGFSPLNGGPK